MAVVLILSITFFYLTTIFFFDITHAAAGFLAGRLGGTTMKGVISGVTLLPIILIPLYTTLFGAIGGATGTVV